MGDSWDPLTWGRGTRKTAQMLFPRPSTEERTARIKAKTKRKRKKTAIQRREQENRLRSAKRRRMTRYDRYGNKLRRKRGY